MDPAARASKPLFPRLSGGPSGLPPDRVAKHQKARLEGAMVEAVARHGYAGTTVRELVTLAGVSKTTFYEHFEGKQDCFLATFEEIVSQVAIWVGEAYRSGGDFRERLIAGLSTFMGLAENEPAAASLVSVESLTLGAAGVAHRERASESFEVLIQQSFDHSPSDRPVSETTVRAIVTGIRGVAYRFLRAGEGAALPGLVEALVDWALSYQEPDREETLRAMAAAAQPAQPPPSDESKGDAERPGWDEPPDSRASRRALTQRERIIRAAALVVVESGYDSLSIPAISGAAGVSNQTFYEHFDSKRDAFLAAFDVLATSALEATAGAVAAEGDRPEAVGAGIRALLERIAADRLFARLAFFELPTAGPVALDRADHTLDFFASFVEADAAPTGIGPSPSQPIMQAITSGAWAVIQYEIAHGRREDLPALAPELTRIVLAPFEPPAELPA